MAKHEFGIMDETPQPGMRYDEYEPDKYSCISIDDDHIENLCHSIADIPTFYHAVDFPCFNLNYCGITLISPQSAILIAGKIGENKNLQILKTLLETAGINNKFVIHYGL